MDSSKEFDALRSQGIKVNRARLFHVDFSGEQVYQLLAVLEQRAVAEQNYLDCRQAVAFAEGIRKQVHKQGF